MSKIKTIACVDATDFPEDVENWLIEKEISIHYNHSIAVVRDDGNPFSEWLKKIGYVFSGTYADYIGIIAT